MSAKDSSPEIDFEHLRKYVGDDAELTKEIFGLFKHQADMWSKCLDATAQDDDWCAVMHSLKGTSLAIGAMNLAGLCEAGETLITPRNSQSLREKHIQDILFSIECVCIEIGRWEYRQTLASMRS